MSRSSLQPRDHAETIALFRASIVGAIVQRDMSRGELATALRTIAACKYRPPGSRVSKQFSLATLERWFYAYRRGGLDALRPAPRSDRGRARDLTPEQRQLLLDIRREHPTASVPLILRTLVADGRLAKGAVSATTVAAALSRSRAAARRAAGWPHAPAVAGRPPGSPVARRCLPRSGASRRRRPRNPFGSTRSSTTPRATSSRSRRTTASARTTCSASSCARYAVTARPTALYLDNGSTYRGETLRLACERLDVTLLHARPDDAPARGKMERFWRTLRQGCLDHLGTMTSLHDVQARLLAFLDAHYHHAPHGGLIGKTARRGVGRRDARASSTSRAHHARSRARAPPRAPGRHRRYRRRALAARPGLPGRMPWSPSPST